MASATLPVNRIDWLSGYGLGATLLSDMAERGVTIATDFSQIEQRIMNGYTLADVQATLGMHENLDLMGVTTGRFNARAPN